LPERFCYFKTTESRKKNMTTKSKPGLGMGDVNFDEIEVDSLPTRTPSAASPAPTVATASYAVTGEGASNESDEGEGDSSDLNVTVALLDHETSRTEEEAEVAEARADMFWRLGVLSQLVRSKDAAGKNQIEEMPYDERLARALALLDELSILIDGTGLLAPLTETEASVRAEALADKALLELIKEGGTPADSRAEDAAEAERKAEFDKNFAAAARAAAPTGVAMPQVNNSMPGQVRTQIKVGRAPDNDWVIDDRTVSAHHALLTLLDGSIKVEDLNSSNGTFVADTLGGWTKVQPGHPETAMISQPVRFGSIAITSSHDDQNLTHLHFIDQPAAGGQLAKLSPSMIFFMGDQRINAEEAARPKPPATAEREARRPVRSPTEMQREIAAGGSSKQKLATVLGGGLGIVLVVGIMVAGTLWMKDHIPHVTLAEVTSPTTPTTPTTPTPTSTVTYSCRPGSERSECSAVEDFLLGGGESSGSGGYWNCADLTPVQYRDIYRPADPTGRTPGVIANVCSCQYCEPTSSAHSS